MSRMTDKKAGYTLVELLVVIGIIALLAGVSIPAIQHIGGFYGNKADEAARDVYGALRAARLSAIGDRNDTAVVYLLNRYADSNTHQNVWALDGFAIARRARPQDIAAIRASADPELQTLVTAIDNNDQVSDNDIFVLPNLPQAQFRKLPNRTAIIGHLNEEEERALRAANDFDQPPTSIAEFTDGRPADLIYRGLAARGMERVFLVRETDDGFVPLQAPFGLESSLTVFGDAVIPTALQAICYPAHIFRSTGDLVAFGDSTVSSGNRLKERFCLNVGPSPDADLDTRFTVAPDQGTPLMVSPVRVEIFRSTGRVDIGS